jgi:Putative transposase
MDTSPERTSKLATWSGNSLKVRLPHVLDWLAAHRVDALCLQATKLVDEKFPVAEIEAAGYRAVLLSPLEFMQRLAALVPRPRLHLIRYHGVLAPNATLRARVVPQGPAARGPAAGDAQPVQARAQHIGWARRLERVFDIDLQRCPSCGAGESATGRPARRPVAVAHAGSRSMR